MRYSFDDFTLDTATGELLRAGDVIALRRQTFRLLQLLIERAPDLLSVDTLLDEIWGRTALARNAVPQAISELRRALGDQAESPRYIETRHRRGYRFLASVRRECIESVDATLLNELPTEHVLLPSKEAPSILRRQLGYATGLTCLLLLAGWFLPQFSADSDGHRTTVSQRSQSLVLAALPADGDVPPWVAPAALEFFVQRLSDSRIRLVRSDALGFEAGAQDLRWQHQSHDLLGADHALSGRWRTAENGDLVLDLNVVELAHGEVVASQKFQASAQNLEAIVDEASSRIASTLQIAPPTVPSARQPINSHDGTDYANALRALQAGQPVLAAATLTALHERLPDPRWMEATLIKAWVEGGNQTSAIALLDRRLEGTQSLPLGDRLRLQAQIANLRFQPSLAAGAYRALVDLYPDDVENALRLIDSELDALQGESARKSLARLATLPTTQNDPRLHLLKSRIALLDSDFVLAAHEADTARRIARQYGLPAIAVSSALAAAAALRGQGQLDDAAEILAETDQAWSMRVDSQSFFDLRLRRVQMLREQERSVDAQKVLDQLQSGVTSTVQAAQVAIESALLQTMAGQRDEANASLQSAKKTIDQSTDPSLVVSWLNADAITAIARNDVGHAQQSFGQAFGLARSNGLSGRYVALQVNAGTALVRENRFIEADHLWQDALETFELLADRRGQAICLGNLAASASSQGLLERSHELNGRALVLFRDLHMSGPQARTAYNLALAATRDGKLQTANHYYQEAGAAAKADGQNDLALRAAVGEAEIALTSGNAINANRIVESVSHAELASPISQSHLLAMKARVALTQGNLTASRQLHEQALGLRKQDGNKSWIALSELELERNDLLSGRPIVRVQIASEALARRFRELGEVRDEARAWLLVADAQLARNKLAEAIGSLDRVRALSTSFSDRAESFDLEWAEARASHHDERCVRLLALKQRAQVEGYIAQAKRAERALAEINSGAEETVVLSR